MEMLNRAAAKLSLFLYCKNYIDSGELEWCIYVTEKLILRIIFLTFTFTWVVLTASPVETLVSVSVFCFLRSKIGGYHAKHVTVCLLLSSLLVISCSPAVEALLEIHQPTFWAINIAVMLIGYFIKPMYPSAAAVSEEDARKNNRTKRLLLLLILLIQALTELINLRLISVSLFYGVMMAITSVIIIKKEGSKNENH